MRKRYSSTFGEDCQAFDYETFQTVDRWVYLMEEALASGRVVRIPREKSLLERGMDGIDF